VLGVHEDPAPLPDQQLHRVGDHRQVLRPGGAQRAFDMTQVALGHQGDDRRLGVEQGTHLRVVRRPQPGLAGGTERRELGVLQVEVLGGPLEELGVLRHGAGPAALDEADAELVQQRDDRQLVRDGQVDALLLRAITQGGVVHVERRGAHGGTSFTVCGTNKKTPRGAEGLRVGPVRPTRYTMMIAKVVEVTRRSLHRPAPKPSLTPEDSRGQAGVVRPGGAARRAGRDGGRTGCR
jgi:hypothetical protein